MSETAVRPVEVVGLSGRSFSSNNVEPPSPAFQPQSLGQSGVWPSEGFHVLQPLNGCLLHIDNKEKVSVWVTVVKLEPICHTALREWLRWTAFWQDSCLIRHVCNLSRLLYVRTGIYIVPSGVCKGRGSLFEVILSLCVCVCARQKGCWCASKTWLLRKLTSWSGCVPESTPAERKVSAGLTWGQFAALSSFL